MPKMSERKCRGSPAIHPVIEAMESPDELERLKERSTSDPISGRRGATLRTSGSFAVTADTESDCAFASCEAPSKPATTRMSCVVELRKLRIMNVRRMRHEEET